MLMSLDKLTVIATLLGDYSDEGDVRAVGERDYRFKLEYSGNVSTAKRMRVIQEAESSLWSQGSGSVYPSSVSLVYDVKNISNEIIIELSEAYATTSADEFRLVDEDSVNEE